MLIVGLVAQGGLVTGELVPHNGNRDLDIAMHPAWRDAIMHYVFWQGFDAWSPQSVQAVADDLTFNKGKALRGLAPDSGGYFNEVSNRLYCPPKCRGE